VEQRVKAMDTLDKKMQTILEREVLSADERLKLYDQSFTRYLNVYDDYKPRPVAVAPEPVKKDLIDNEILESVPKTMKAKVQLLLKKMKSSPDISLNEKRELKYKGETVQGSNVVDLVNDVLSKRQYFNPQGWVTFGEALREGNVPQDSIGHEDRWIYITQTKRTPRSRKTEYIPYYTVLPKNTKKQKERSPELGRLFKRRLRPQRGSCRHGVDLLQPFSSRQLWRIE
jgi:hypothetical protein